MKPAPVPPNDAARVARLHQLQILDTPEEARFDRITRIGRKLFEVPIVLVSLVDANRQWFKSCIGLNVKETRREVSFCGHAILEDNLFIVPDTFQDFRFADNPLVTGDPGIRFYAGFPLSSANDFKLGTFCVMDHRPRNLTMEERGLLKDLATIVEDELNR